MDRDDALALLGDAEITGSWDGPFVGGEQSFDVAFTNIHDEQMNERPNIYFSDLARFYYQRGEFVTSNWFGFGVPHSDVRTVSIHGRTPDHPGKPYINAIFYGNRGEEVAGAFNHGSIIGAFGAKRDQ